MFHAQNRVEPIIPPPTNTFTVDDIDVFTYLQSYKTIAFTADPDNTVTVISKPNWVSTIVIDDVNNTITITVSENTSIARSGNIVFHCANGASDVTKKISQSAVLTPNYSGTGFNDEVWKTFVLPDGKIIVNGFFNKYNGINCKGGVIVLNPDLTIATDYSYYSELSTTSIINNEQYQFVAINLINNVLYGIFKRRRDFDYVSCPRTTLKALTIDGHTDPTFDTNFQALITNGYLVKDNSAFYGTNIVLPISNNRLFIAGNFTFKRNRMDQHDYMILNNDATIDDSAVVTTGFTSGSGEEWIEDAVLFEDRILVIGSFEKFNTRPVKNILMLNFNGSRNTEFTSPIFESYPSDLPLWQVEKADDTSFIVFGVFKTCNTVFRGGITRIDIYGSDLGFDTQFDLDTNIPGSVQMTMAGSIEGIYLNNYSIEPGYEVFNTVGGDKYDLMRFTKTGTLKTDFETNLTKSYERVSYINHINEISPHIVLIAGGYGYYAPGYHVDYTRLFYVNEHGNVLGNL